MKWGLVSCIWLVKRNRIATAAALCRLLLMPNSTEDAAKPGFTGQGAYSFAWTEEICWLLVRAEQEK